MYLQFSFQTTYFFNILIKFRNNYLISTFSKFAWLDQKNKKENSTLPRDESTVDVWMMQTSEKLEQTYKNFLMTMVAPGEARRHQVSFIRYWNEKS